MDKYKTLRYIPNCLEEEKRQKLVEELEKRGCDSLIFDFLNDSIYIDITIPIKTTIGVNFMRTNKWNMPYVLPHIQISNKIRDKFDYTQLILDQIEANVYNKILLLPYNATLSTFKTLLELFQKYDEKNFTVLVPMSMEREEIKLVLRYCVANNLKYVDIINKQGDADIANLVTIVPEYSNTLIMGVRECWFHEARKYDPLYNQDVLSIAVYMKLGLIHFSRKIAQGRGGSNITYKFYEKDLSRVEVQKNEFQNVKNMIGNNEIVKNYFRLKMILSINQELSSFDIENSKISNFLKTKNLYVTDLNSE